jgi:hypothetical protein
VAILELISEIYVQKSARVVTRNRGYLGCMGEIREDLLRPLPTLLSTADRDRSAFSDGAHPLSGRDIAAAALFDHPTVAEPAAYLHGGDGV